MTLDVAEHKGIRRSPASAPWSSPPPPRCGRVGVGGRRRVAGLSCAPSGSRISQTTSVTSLAVGCPPFFLTAVAQACFHCSGPGSRRSGRICASETGCTGAPELPIGNSSDSTIAILVASCPETRLQRNALISSLLGGPCWGGFGSCFRVFGRSNCADERDEADGGGAGRLDQPAAGGRDRLSADRWRKGR